MGEAARRLLQDALELPLDERRQLAEELVESLDDAAPHWDRAWRAELDARLTAMRGGAEEELTLESFRRRLDAMVSR